MTTQRSYMKAFLQMSVEIATLHGICYSEKCCVKLSGFMNKKTHLTGFEHRNCMYWAHLLQWDIHCVLSQSRLCHHWSCVECRYAVIRAATNTKLLQTFFGCLCLWFARHLSLQEQCLYQYDVTSHSAQQIYISHRTLCYEKPIILLVGVIWPCCQVILLGNTEERSEMESIFLKTCLLWSLFVFGMLVDGYIALLVMSRWELCICWMVLSGKLKYVEENLFQCPFIHHKSHVECSWTRVSAVKGCLSWGVTTWPGRRTWNMIQQMCGHSRCLYDKPFDRWLSTFCISVCVCVTVFLQAL